MHGHVNIWVLLKISSIVVLFVYFIPSLSSCDEKMTVALYFGVGRILTHFAVADFQVFRLIF